MIQQIHISGVQSHITQFRFSLILVIILSNQLLGILSLILNLMLNLELPTPSQTPFFAGILEENVDNIKPKSF